MAFTVLLHTQVYAREIALTFDDCPRKAGPLLEPMERDKKLVVALKNAGITAAFFCNSPSRESDGAKRIQYFADHGHLIANHSADHPDLYKTPVDAFNKGIDQADRELRAFPNFRKWFRFPFLHEGKNPQDIEGVRAHLKRIGYTNGYITVDTEDWYVDEALRQKLTEGKGYHEDRLCRTYAKIMADDADFFDDMSIKAIGRSVKHVILLHETDLNAICLDALVRELKFRKWSLISPDDAYKDPVAKIETLSSTKLNQGRVFAIAKESGYNGPWYSKWNEESEIDKELARQKVWK
jgi:peptidoglycan/xylan/chitin deacetylase (PgdA/CDA1 family)